ncbi:hypothetical protein ACMX2H_18355 [Arthrobacter sulfonylureivorans]|uniref:hypothetical protein n=1 Tax=Arthrobacter sulfonylureivorans TaxID=2486855 RepID=UPI0039E576C6
MPNIVKIKERFSAPRDGGRRNQIHSADFVRFTSVEGLLGAPEARLLRTTFGRDTTRIKDSKVELLGTDGHWSLIDKMPYDDWAPKMPSFYRDDTTETALREYLQNRAEELESWAIEVLSW